MPRAGRSSHRAPAGPRKKLGRWSWGQQAMRDSADESDRSASKSSPRARRSPLASTTVRVAAPQERGEQLREVALEGRKVALCSTSGRRHGRDDAAEARPTWLVGPPRRPPEAPQSGAAKHRLERGWNGRFIAGLWDEPTGRLRLPEPPPWPRDPPPGATAPTGRSGWLVRQYSGHHIACPPLPRRARAPRPPRAGEHRSACRTSRHRHGDLPGDGPEIADRRVERPLRKTLVRHASASVRRPPGTARRRPCAPRR